MNQTQLPSSYNDDIQRGASNGSFDLAAAALRRLDEDLTRSVMLPPIESVIRRADGMNRTVTAATAAVLTVGALGGVTVVAQSVVSGAVPLPVPVALAPAPPAVEQLAGPPAVAEVLNPGEQLVRLQPGVVPPAGSRLISNGSTVLAPGAIVPVVNTVPGTKFDSNGNTDRNDSSSRNDDNERNYGRSSDNDGRNGRGHNGDGANDNNGGRGGDHNGPGTDPNPPVNQDPPKQDPPKQDPPKQDPPVNQGPPKQDPPKQDPPVKTGDQSNSGGGNAAGNRARGGKFFSGTPRTNPPSGTNGPTTDKKPASAPADRAPMSAGTPVFKRPARTPDSSSNGGDSVRRTPESGFSRNTGTGRTQMSTGDYGATPGSGSGATGRRTDNGG